VYRFAVNPAGTRLVAVGNFTSVGGQTRYRAFMLTLGAMAPPWNPTKERGVGGKDLYVTSQGLWVGSDTDLIGGETRRRIALMPVP
jgi:hypothetical protein